MLDPRRKAYLAAMGIDLWTAKSADALAVEQASLQPASVGQTVSADRPVVSKAPAAPVAKETPETVERPAVASPSQSVLKKRAVSGKQKDLQQANAASQEKPFFDPFAADVGYEDDDDDLASQYSDESLYLSAELTDAPLEPAIATLGWDELTQRVIDCEACKRCNKRNNTVFGVGNKSASLMVIGDAPTVEDDKQGLPFMSKNGQLLSAMLKAIGLNRDDVYLTSSLKCYSDEAQPIDLKALQPCYDYLARQIALVKPKIILSLSEVTAQSLFDSHESLDSLRQKTEYFGDAKVPLIASYHPAYLIANPQEKAKSWQDLQKLHSELY